jgi:hypothetical protein
MLFVPAGSPLQAAGNTQRQRQSGSSGSVAFQLSAAQQVVSAACLPFASLPISQTPPLLQLPAEGSMSVNEAKMQEAYGQGVGGMAEVVK